ncbi:hypothetical protein GCM10007972_06290 [Iodidimonas muriae]|uniref:Uncharacterized protein n=1 Tax=Iodidimonas muriae TaxID=261467 RepID=A0ABQ2L9E4_9PROT|nr:hypothetical protein JCM17843_01740 [Kordiimonadales bacterium JCM 17843]GGO07190.1 hypothetical protein GCM10007972_06290 [Iodidimonas muriae]
MAWAMETNFSIGSLMADPFLIAAWAIQAARWLGSSGRFGLLASQAIGPLFFGICHLFPCDTVPFFPNPAGAMPVGWVRQRIKTMRYSKRRQIEATLLL